MPSVKILRNIGTTDCATLGIDPHTAREGQVLSCAQEVADELIRCGMAEHVEEQEAPQHKQGQQRQQPPRQ
jgi:hypothetical protein